MATRILIVDDEQDVEMLFRQRFRKILREGQIELEFAFSGETALNMLSRNDVPEITLILSDINMPGMSGFDLLQEVKKTHPSLKVMMITAYGDEEHESKARKLGADEFLTKPINFPVLWDKISNYLSSQGLQ